jgi:antirestriction protein ArdC
MATATRTRRKKPAAVKVDVYQVITDKIVELLDSGTAPWHKPWNSETGMPLSMSTGKAYRGVNVFLLAMESAIQGYASPWWGTYNQISGRGGQVRKGQKSTMVILWKPIIKVDEETGKRAAFFMLRTFNVFNAEQTEDPSVLGLTESTNWDNDNDPIDECEAAVREYLATGPRLSIGGDRAAYSPSLDVVLMPERDSFDGSAQYYGALFHELTHSTGHESRLARKELMENHAFGDAAYSREELVAEMGAAFLSGMTGIDAVTLPNSAAYLQNWLSALRGDKKLVVIAAAQAQKAAELILGVTHEEKSDD